MNTVRSLFAVSILVLSMNASADQSWRVTFHQTDGAEAVQLLGQMFQLTPVNPGASCLKEPVSFTSPEEWRSSEAKELISRVAKQAGCGAVIYEGDKFIVQESVLGA